jgi:hypothetical protein
MAERGTFGIQVQDDTTDNAMPSETETMYMSYSFLASRDENLDIELAAYPCEQAYIIADLGEKKNSPSFERLLSICTNNLATLKQYT